MLLRTPPAIPGANHALVMYIAPLSKPLVVQIASGGTSNPRRKTPIVLPTVTQSHPPDDAQTTKQRCTWHYKAHEQTIKDTSIYTLRVGAATSAFTLATPPTRAPSPAATRTPRRRRASRSAGTCSPWPSAARCARTRPGSRPAAPTRTPTAAVPLPGGATESEHRLFSRTAIFNGNLHCTECLCRREPSRNVSFVTLSSLPWRKPALLHENG